MLRVLPLALAAFTLVAAEGGPPASEAARTTAEAARAALTSQLIRALAADDPAARAWAAYEIGRSRLTDAYDALLPLARQVPERDAKAQRDCLQAVLDALILLERPVPREVVEAAMAGWSTYHGLILASRDPATHQEALLALSEGAVTDPVWLGCCQLLAPLRPPRLARRLLGDLTLRLELEVTDHHRAGGGRRRALTRFGDGSVKLSPGFPPAGIYTIELAEDAEPGAVLLSRGYRSVMWRRLELADGAGTGGHHGEIDRNDARIALLSRMPRTTYTGPLKPTTSAVLTVDEGEAPYLDQARAAYERLAEERDHFAQALIDDGLLDAQAPRPRIVVAVHDWRTDPAEPLPALPYEVEPAPERKP